MNFIPQGPDPHTHKYIRRKNKGFALFSVIKKKSFKLIHWQNVLPIENYNNNYVSNTQFDHIVLLRKAINEQWQK
jgi:hypothetical protein